MVASANYDPITVEPHITEQKVRELLGVARESAKLDYKRQYDPQVRQDVVELTKDLIAMANTAGGYIVIGIDDDGTARGLTENETKALDEATLRGQVEAFVGASLELFLNVPVMWNRMSLAIVTILRSPRSPIVFEKDGQYSATSGSSKSYTIFRAGDVFVRHGSRSERWNQDDVRTIYARVVGREKERWLAEVLPDIRRLVTDSFGLTLPPPSSRDLLNQDAEAFERSLRDLMRRTK